MRQLGVLLFPFICLFTISACMRLSDPAPALDLGLEGGRSAGTVTVHKGDTLWDISQRFNLPMRDIIRLNTLNAPFRLDVGERLKLPPPSTYTVRPGDSLYTIARQFDTDTYQVARLNDIRKASVIHPGDKLRIPSAQIRERLPRHKKPRVAQPTSRPKAPGRAENVRVLSPPDHLDGPFRRPVSGRIISSYGPKENGLHNDGINITAPRGRPVSAAQSGTVVYAGDAVRGYGNLVLVRHADNFLTAYAHLDKVEVTKGTKLKRGQRLGTVGSSGGVDSPQLHFEIRRGTQAVNPAQFL